MAIKKSFLKSYFSKYILFFGSPPELGMSIIGLEYKGMAMTENQAYIR